MISNNSYIPTVGELTSAIRTILEESIGEVTIKGEISNYKEHTSGHKYFILKDETAQISCTLWKGRRINFTPKEGMKVVLKGDLTVYPQRGQYQIECKEMQPLGIGDLFLAYEALKLKLEEKGYFDVNRKRRLPDIFLSVGVATSQTGAAIQDILSTIKRRLPLTKIYFRPTLVQGDGSSEDIVRAITELQKYPIDVMVIGRGGGSIEDLWSFNTESVADAIFKSKIPVISAVGHETDFTIADFVADVRAATPTAAAELVTPYTDANFYEIFNSAQNQLLRNIKSIIEIQTEKINHLTGSNIIRRISDKIKNFEQQIDEFEIRTHQSIKGIVNSYKQKTILLESHCRSVNPYIPFKKGFALLKSNDKIILPEESLGNYITIDIIRQKETAKATINQIIKI